MPRLKKCHHCKTPTPKDQGLQTPDKFFCSMEHATTYANARLDRLRFNEAKKLMQRHKEAKARARKATMEQKRFQVEWQHKRTQTAFNKMRVLEELLWFQEQGLEPVCISCSQPLGGDQWACGHYKSKGHNQALRYVRENTFLQHNHRCNLKLSGDIQGTDTTHGFTQGIVKRFGQVESTRIFAIINKRHQKNMQYHWLELENMRKEFNKRIIELKKQLIK